MTMDQLEEVHDVRMNDFGEEANEEERDAAADAVIEAYLAINLAILRKSNARAVSSKRSWRSCARARSRLAARSRS